MNKLTGNEPINPTEVDTSSRIPHIYNYGLPNQFTGEKLVRGEIVKHTGLTIRQHFAGLAMQGMAASEYWSKNFTKVQTDLQNMAEVAAMAADALIEELNKPRAYNP